MSGVVQVAAAESGVVGVEMSDVTLSQMLSDEVINEAPEDEVVSDESQETTEAEQPEKTEGEQGEADSESTGDTEDSTPGSSDDDSGLTGSELGHYKAYKAERAKRQELERKLEESQSKTQEPEKVPDVIDDPEGFQSHIDRKLFEVELRSRINVSQAMMRREHKDYDEKERKFLEIAKDDPTLIQQMQSSDFPAEFVYNTVAKHERFEKFDSFDDALKQEVEKQKPELEKRIREELEKEYQGKYGKLSKLPPSGASGLSIADDASAITPTPLRDILGTPKSN